MYLKYKKICICIFVINDKYKIHLNSLYIVVLLLDTQFWISIHKGLKNMHFTQQRHKAAIIILNQVSYKVSSI